MLYSEKNLSPVGRTCVRVALSSDGETALAALTPRVNLRGQAVSIFCDPSDVLGLAGVVSGVPGGAVDHSS